MPTREEQDSAQASKTLAAAMMELRMGFRMHGFDVSAYSDDQVRGAIVAAATAAADSSGDLFTRAFERLKTG